MKKMMCAGFICLLLASCASYYTSNAEKTYRQSRNGLKLVVPPPLTDTNISYFYNLPPQNEDAKVSIEPPQG